MADQYGLYAPTTFADPYPVYRRLREEAPVYWLEPFGPWVVSRYRDVVAALRDPRLSSAIDREDTSILMQTLSEQERTIFRLRTLAVVYTDPPAHTRIRAAMRAAFLPRMAAARLIARQIVNELLDAVQQRGMMDIVADLAFPFPAMVMADLLQVTRADLRRPIERQPSDGATLDLLDYFRVLIAERRAARGDDLISALITVAERDAALDDDELIAACIQFLFAGRESTPHVLASGVLALLRHPDQLDRLRHDPTLLPLAVEEMLRYDSAALIHPRVATSDLTIAGRRIGAGQRVFLLLGSANRDPEEFPAPDRFDAGRHPNRHVGFGYGIHLCLGAPLARIEIATAIDVMLRRLPDIRLAAGILEYRSETEFRYLKSLPVSFTPGAGGGPH